MAPCPLGRGHVPTYTNPSSITKALHVLHMPCLACYLEYFCGVAVEGQGPAPTAAAHARSFERALLLHVITRAPPAGRQHAPTRSA